MILGAGWEKKGLMEMAEICAAKLASGFASSWAFLSRKQCFGCYWHGGGVDGVVLVVGQIGGV